MVNVQLLTRIHPGSLLVHLHTWINGERQSTFLPVMDIIIG